MSPNPGQSHLAFRALAEPVHVEDPRGVLAESVAHRQPVLEVIGHVVAAEGLHGEGVAPEVAHGADIGRGRLRRGGGAHEHAVVPVIGLVDQGHDACAAAAEDEDVDRNALGLLPVRADDRALSGPGR